MLRKTCGSTTCPTCGKTATIVDWSQNCECDNCGAVFNLIENNEKELERKRREFARKTGVLPPNKRRSIF